MSSQYAIDYLPRNGEEDYPTPGPLVARLGGIMDLPCIVYGAGTFSNQYNTEDHITSTLPIQAVRLALRYGIRAFDTSAYYGPSEIVLGNVLEALREEFPRSSYQIMTKCGRYGLSTFDYAPTNIRESVKRSLERLKTDYLDTVYLHDVEFVADAVTPRTTGDHSIAIGEEAAAYGLAEGDEARIRGDGDQQILDAIAQLQQLQGEGTIRNIGITGYPLPTLLRLAILILHTPPYKPLDVLLSYSHLCLQNSTFLDFIPHFYRRAKIGQLLAASPLSMGLLTPNPPQWHPAPPALREAVAKSGKNWPEGLPNLGVGYSMRHTISAPQPLPLIVGFSAPREVHECVKVWREVQDGSRSVERDRDERIACGIFNQAGYWNWSWASP